jgi:hypothetical protein
MQVKKATVQRMGSGGKGTTENRWDVSGAGQSATPAVYHIIPLLSTSKRESAVDHQNDDRW